jgi:TnpA family transposase
MPVDFVTEEQERRYGRYNGEPSEAQLAKYFYLSETDLDRVRKHRGDQNRLGFAVQLCTVRFLGTFLANPLDVPPGAVAFVAAQLGITDVSCLSRYLDRETTHREHVGEIQRSYEYRDFTDQPAHFQLVRWLYTRAWLTAERPSVLFDLATARLVERKILLPGVSQLARLVASVRDHAQERLWRVLAQMPTTEQCHLLETLLIIPEGERQTPLDRLRRAPTRVTALALVAALHRIEAVRLLGVRELDLSFLPSGRVKALARYVQAARIQTLSRMPKDRRLASLLAFACAFEATAHDDALDIFDLLLRTTFSRAKRAGQQERLRTIRDLDAAALQLREACLVVLDTQCVDAAVREQVFTRIPQAQLAAAVTAVGELTRPPDDTYAEELIGKYALMRRFLPTFLRTLEFESTPGGRSVLDAVHFLRRMEGRRIAGWQAAPREVITRPWRRYVINHERQVDRPAYTLCVIDRLQEALRRHDVFVSPSDRWGDPRAKLLQGEAWEAGRAQVCRMLGRESTPEPELTSLKLRLHEAYLRTAANLPTNTSVRIERRAGQDTLVITGLDRVVEPDSLQRLRGQVQDRLPLVDLPEVILEIERLTGFGSAFSHLSEGNTRADELSLSICAVLLAEACNVGLTPLIHPDIPALTRERLSWVQQNYLRAETLTRANALIVEAHAQLSLANVWGGGEVASVDGLRFVVPVRSINSGPNPRYFGVGRGVTYLNYTSDQFSGLNGIVIPGTIRDSVYILECLLEQQTTLNPVEIMTDSASYSDLMFGCFWLLGYQFSPRLSDIGETHFWRIDPQADYGPLNGLARNRINLDLIARNWDDMLRVAGSLKLGTVNPSTLIRALQGGGRPTTLARAISEVGRIAKSLHLLSYADDEFFRRRIQIQLNRGEGRHAVARDVFHGQKGELRQRYREGQEDQLGALGLVVNIVLLWNTLYMQDALDDLRAKGHAVLPEDIERLSPLTLQHMNLQGTYHFTLPESVAQGNHRPLRRPSNEEPPNGNR